MSPAAFIDNPNWAADIPEMREGMRARHLPGHDDCAALDAEAAAEHLRRGGTLGAMPRYEERPGQIEMLKAIVRAFNAREHLMIEAGTGVGKSLAYLIPSILWAWTNDTPVIVATATRNLQSQLIDSDIPRATSVLGENAAKFRYALLKGRGNYVCLRAVDDFFASGYWTMSEQEQALMPEFIEWLTTTEDGDLDRYDGLPRSLLSCPGEDCSARRCRFYSRCFVYKARRAAAAAHLVVANHALVLADAASPGGGVLPASGRLVLDEAHNLEDAATDYLSSEFSLPAFTRILNRLTRRARGRRARASGALASVERLIQKGALAHDDATRVSRALARAPGLVVKAFTETEALVDVVLRLLTPARGRDVCRYKTVDGLRLHALNHLFEPYDEDVWRETDLDAAEASFEGAVAALVNLLHELRDALSDAAAEDPLSPAGDLATQLDGLAENLVAFVNETHFTLRGEKDTHAYWIERVRDARRASYVRLVAAPLSVAEDLDRMLYDVKDSVVLCSATLRVGNDFRYMTRRLGCTRRFTSLVAASPFDYLSQALVLAPDCLPDPSSDSKRYAEQLAALLTDVFAVTRGRALVLFTSYEMMRAVAEGARDALAESGIALLVQGEGPTREKMARALREAASDKVVLFGAQSFWEGVDVAGEALSCVVIARLPFAQIGEPVVEARGERIEREGGSAFRDYALPEAVIAFRQGFGRLIRTKDDRGVVIVTDPRLVTKGYGAIFRRSIPASVHTVTDLGDLVARIDSFLGA